MLKKKSRSLSIFLVNSIVEITQLQVLTMRIVQMYNMYTIINNKQGLQQASIYAGVKHENG